MRIRCYKVKHISYSMKGFSDSIERNRTNLKIEVVNRISGFLAKRKRIFNENLNSTIFYIILHVIGYIRYVTNAYNFIECMYITRKRIRN